MPERSVKLARDFRLSRTVTKSKLQFTEKKNGGHLKRGGLSNARLFVAAVRLRCGRKPVSWGGTNQPAGCQSRAHPFIETIHFSDYSNFKNFHLHAPPVGLHSAAEDTKKPWNIGD